MSLTVSTKLLRVILSSGKMLRPISVTMAMIMSRFRKSVPGACDPVHVTSSVSNAMNFRLMFLCEKGQASKQARPHNDSQRLPGATTAERVGCAHLSTFKMSRQKTAIQPRPNWLKKARSFSLISSTLSSS